MGGLIRTSRVRDMPAFSAVERVEEPVLEIERSGIVRRRPRIHVTGRTQTPAIGLKSVSCVLLIRSARDIQKQVCPTAFLGSVVAQILGRHTPNRQQLFVPF